MVSPRRLQSFADEEAASLRDRLRRKIPRQHRVSIFLYQPLSAEIHPAGRLVDVAPGPSQALTELVFQPVGAGKTGLLFGRTEASEIYEPECQAIDDEAVRTYEKLMPLDLRRVQVKLERSRYPDVQFAHDALPPHGAFLHQLPLAPSAVDLDLLELPVLGIIYTMTPFGQRTETVRHLIHISQTVSQVALLGRADHLWGKSLVDIAKREVDPSLVSKDRPRPPLDELMRLCFMFLLSHHWFFPHKPSAWIGLKQSLGEGAAALYTRFGWPRPPALLQEIGGETDSWVELLYNDLIHVVRQLCGPIHEVRHPNNLLVAMSTILTILTGEIKAMRSEDQRDGTPPIFVDDPKRGDLIALDPKRELLRGLVDIPVFKREGFKNACANRRKGKSSQWLDRFLPSIQPGATPYQGRGAYIKPDLWLHHTGNGTVVTVKYDNNHEHQNKWLILLAQLVLEMRTFEREGREMSP